MNSEVTKPGQRTALVVGAHSLIGSAISDRLRNDNWFVSSTARPGRCEYGMLPLDLGGAEDEWPDLPVTDSCLIAAAVTSLPECRRNPEESRRVNVTGTVSLARRLLSRGTQVIFLSTNLVFDGSRAERQPDEAVSPVTMYGQQKAEAEAALARLDGEVAIIRLTKVLSPKALLMRQWREDLRNAISINPFHDKVLAPISIDWLADLIIKVMEGRAKGVLHASGNEDLTYAYVARSLACALDVEPSLVNPIPHADRDIPPEDAPPHTTLAMEKTCSRIEITAPRSRVAVDDVIANLIR